jgi:hypothetical protein
MKYINFICSNLCAFRGLKDKMFQAVQTLQFCKTLLEIRKQFLKLLIAYIPLKNEKKSLFWHDHPVCVCVCVCVCPFPFKLLKQLTDFHKTLFEHIAIGGHPTAVFHISYHAQKECGGCSNLWGVSFTTATNF